MTSGSLTLRLCVAACLALAPPALADGRAQALADKLLDAVGGRELWRSARYVHTTAVNRHPDARLPYIQEAWIDLAEMRHRIRLTNFDMQRVRAYTAASGWGITEREHYAFTPERLAQAHDAYRQLIYRKLRLLAERDGGLAVSLTDGRLMFEYRGDDLGWIEVDPGSGAPLAAGSSETDEATRFGALVEFGPVRWVASGRATSGWGFDTLAFELLPDGAAIEFAPPPGFRPPVAD